MKKNRILIGAKFKKGNTYLKIMTFCEGYYMVRYKGAMPFCIAEKELEIKIQKEFCHEEKEN